MYGLHLLKRPLSSQDLSPKGGLLTQEHEWDEQRRKTIRQTTSTDRSCLFKEVFPWLTIPPLPRHAPGMTAPMQRFLQGSQGSG